MNISRSRKGFTLIELLVVISILALLVAILMPALNRARQQATSAVCLANQKSLILAWMMYEQEYEGSLPCGYIHEDLPNCWVYPPIDENGNDIGGAGDNVTHEDRLRGLRAGVLYEYLKNTDVYNCPGDNRWLKGSKRYGNSERYHMYRSYCISIGIAAISEPGVKETDGYDLYNYTIHKSSEIRQPSEKYVFVEEAYDGQSNYNFNDRSWSFYAYREAFWDPLALFHNDATTLAFADGHAEMHRWEDDRTIQYFTNRNSGDRDTVGADNPDVHYMQRRFAHNYPDDPDM